ncbi:MAG: TetR family transcriptional regulator [Deltaproteobacteria bacterium]|nr:TetR family transcriptional regulator [Deltaproteobacteria bacterium]
MNAKAFKELDKSARKQRIIDTAITVFQQKGYHQANIEDVANNLGVTKGALYHYFPSKEAILSVIYMQAMGNYFADYANPDQLSGLNLSPPEKMRFFLRNHIQKVAIDNLAMLDVFLSEEHYLPPKDQKTIRQAKQRYNRVLQDIIEEGIAENHFKPFDARLLANAILGMCNSLCRWYKTKKGGFGSKEVIELITNLLECGYLADRASSVNTTTYRSTGKQLPETLKEEFKREQERHEAILSSLIEQL